MMEQAPTGLQRMANADVLRKIDRLVAFIDGVIDNGQQGSAGCDALLANRTISKMPRPNFRWQPSSSVQAFPSPLLWKRKIRRHQIS